MIKLSCFATHIHKLFFSNLPQIRIISKKAKLRIGYGQSVPGGMSVGRGAHRQLVIYCRRDMVFEVGEWMDGQMDGWINKWMDLDTLMDG